MVMILNDNINTTDIIILSFELNKFSHILTHRTISNDNKINVFEIYTFQGSNCSVQKLI